MDRPGIGRWRIIWKSVFLSSWLRIRVLRSTAPRPFGLFQRHGISTEDNALPHPQTVVRRLRPSETKSLSISDRPSPDTSADLHRSANHVAGSAHPLCSIHSSTVGYPGLSPCHPRDTVYDRVSLPCVQICPNLVRLGKHSKHSLNG